MSPGEYNTVSEINRNIMHKFIISMQNSRKITSERTISNNAMIIKFMLQNIKTDLDKLTIDDIEDIQAAITNWERKDGKPAADASKKVYSVGVKKFLNWYAKRYEQPKYKNFAELIEIGGDAKKVLANDLLTTAEIEKMIITAAKIRDKAIIAVFAESGCRAGELISCRIKDVEFTGDGFCHLTFPKGKTGSRTVPLVFAASYIDHYLRQHPLHDNPESPLWLTERQGEWHGLAYATIHGIVRDVAKDAGIKKRVHPHLFRHTTATQLSKIWGESMLRTFLGWEANSNMPSIYISLSGEDVDNAVLSDRYGMIEKKQDDKGLEIGKCPKCWKTLPANATFCYNCGAPLTKEAKQAYNTKLQEAMAIISKHPDAVTAYMTNTQQS